MKVNIDDQETTSLDGCFPVTSYDDIPVTVFKTGIHASIMITIFVLINQETWKCYAPSMVVLLVGIFLVVPMVILVMIHLTMVFKQKSSSLEKSIAILNLIIVITIWIILVFAFHSALPHKANTYDAYDPILDVMIIYGGLCSVGSVLSFCFSKTNSGTTEK